MVNLSYNRLYSLKIKNVQYAYTNSKNLYHFETTLNPNVLPELHRDRRQSFHPNLFLILLHAYKIVWVLNLIWYQWLIKYFRTLINI